ncbi:MAG: DNA replication/repair protein RecF [Clostridia bacterium]|nr:DNA replication/repair protein RecF [Clostridia bacterium]
MEIKSVELKNFRNYTLQKVGFKSGLNILEGKNAQGKTNLLEAVFLCAIGKSPRTNKEKELLKWNEQMGKVTIEFTKKSGTKKIELYLFSNQNKAIKINGVPIKKLGELMGELNAIYFSPDELKLVKESPDERRRFMDIDLCQFNKNYFYALNKYNKILNQRNKLLKSGNLQSIKETISIWNEQLSEQACYIILKRLELIDKLKVFAERAHYYLTDNQEKMVLSYVGLTDTSKETLKQKLVKLYETSLEKDLNLGYTTVGPHRDDIKIMVNDVDIRHFGSQGQQRSCALSLKLAELEIFKSNLGEYPVLLLDDVLSELDEFRREKLLKIINNFQTLLTCTEYNLNLPANVLKVKSGTVEN